MTVTLCQNPQCSKSRQTLALLRERGIEPRVVEYVETPPSADELDAILGRLAMQPRALLRMKEGRVPESRVRHIRGLRFRAAARRRPSRRRSRRRRGAHRPRR